MTINDVHALRSDLSYLHNIHSHSQISAESFLYHLGVLTLRDLGVEYKRQRQVNLVVPNSSVRRDYAQEFLKTQIGSTGTMSAFVANPTTETLLACMNRIRRNTIWTNERTETDIVILVGADLFLQSNAYSGGDHHPGDDNRKKMDLRATTDDHFIALELKYVRANATNQNESQSLLHDEANKLELSTTTKGDKYRHVKKHEIECIYVCARVHVSIFIQSVTNN